MLIRPEEAWERIEAELEPLPSETVRRPEAVGRVLVEGLKATVDVPALDVSAMDGFAVQGDLSVAERLSVAGVIAAGDPPGAEITPGTALGIMTGAPVPEGSDRILPVEQTRRIGETEIEVESTVPLDAHIRHQGEVLRTGARLLPASTPLTAGTLGLLATHGYAQVVVHRRPRVAFLATGDEVVPPDQVPRPGQLRDSHTDFLLAAGQSLGLTIEPLGIARDTPESLQAKIEQGLAADVLLIGGGVSKGEFDFVEEVLDGLGCRVLFEAVAIQPGKPLVCASHEGGLVFGLPGNPASVMVSFWLFVRPVLRRLQGIPDAFWSGALGGRLAGPLPGAKGRDRFLTAEVRFTGDEILVTPQLARGSHDLAAFARGSALVRVPALSEPANVGDPCHILPLVDWPDW